MDALTTGLGKRGGLQSTNPEAIKPITTSCCSINRVGGCSGHVIILVLDLCKKSLSSFGKQEVKETLAERGELSIVLPCLAVSEISKALNCLSGVCYLLTGSSDIQTSCNTTVVMVVVVA